MRITRAMRRGTAGKVATQNRKRTRSRKAYVQIIETKRTILTPVFGSIPLRIQEIEKVVKRRAICCKNDKVRIFSLIKKNRNYGYHKN